MPDALECTETPTPLESAHAAPSNVATPVEKTQNSDAVNGEVLQNLPDAEMLQNLPNAEVLQNVPANDCNDKEEEASASSDIESNVVARLL
jgi:hypothetical protein